MKAKLKSSFNYTIAILLILLGFLGTILPIMPGIILIAAGAIILSIENPKLDSFIEKQFSRHPKAEEIFFKIRDKIHKIFA